MRFLRPRVRLRANQTRYSDFNVEYAASSGTYGGDEGGAAEEAAPAEVRCFGRVFGLWRSMLRSIQEGYAEGGYAEVRRTL